MDPIETKCIEIFQLIDWKSIGKGEDYDTYHGLIMEFWRRAANFDRSYGPVHEDSLWDIVKEVFPVLECSPQASDAVEELVKDTPRSARSMFYWSLINYILFEKARAEGLVPSQERNLYTPILKLCQLKGAFYVHHGMMELGDLRQISFYEDDWRRYPDRGVIVDIDDDLNILSIRS